MTRFRAPTRKACWCTPICLGHPAGKTSLPNLSAYYAASGARRLPIIPVQARGCSALVTRGCFDSFSWIEAVSDVKEAAMTGTEVGTAGHSEGNGDWLAAGASLLVGAGFFALWFWLLPRWLGFHVDTTGAARLRWIAVVPSVLGFAVALRCVWDFGRTGHGTPAPIAPPKRLVVVGFYRYVRKIPYRVDRPVGGFRPSEPRSARGGGGGGALRGPVCAVVRRANAAPLVWRA